MVQLAVRVRHIERLKVEKAKAGKYQAKSKARKYQKKGKVAYVITKDYSSDDSESVKETEVNMVELHPGPPYAYKPLRPSNGKNPVETKKNGKAVIKTYTFDITKCDEIFDLLVSNDHIIMPQGLKNPPLEQKKKRGFCKFHNFLGHKTSQCVLFRDLVQKSLKEGRLQFGEKPKMQVDTDPMKVEEALFVKHYECMMVEATKGFDNKAMMVKTNDIQHP